MIALAPRDLAKAGALTLALATAWHLVDRIVAGAVQCAALGCLPQ